MFKAAFALLAFCYLAGPVMAQADPAGAKELFYDPVGASVESIRPDTSRPTSTAGPGRGPRIVKNGRRQPDVIRQEDATPNKTLGLSYWIELVEQSGSPGIQVADSRVFRSGERIRLHFQSNADGHIALLQLGSSGAGRLLFPNTEQGLIDTRLAAGQERILPSDTDWFRFDGTAGTERLIVMFARTREQLGGSSGEPELDETGIGSLLQAASEHRGSKDLVVERESLAASEVGTYGVSLSGQPVVLEIVLQHR